MAKTEYTAQGHILWCREYINKLLPEPENTVTSFVPRNKKEWEEAKNAIGTGRGWRFEIDPKRGLCFRLDKPILRSDVSRVMYEAILEKRPSSQFVAKYERDYGKKSDGSDILAGKISVLSKTTKMGCYSWNLPAGPPRFGGCCPSAGIGFDGGRLGLQAHDIDNERLIQGINRFKTFSAKEYLDSIPDINKPEEARKRFICNGCYALKNSYGNPSIIVAMEWRKKWIKWAVDTGRFSHIMREAIRVAQNISNRKISKATTELKKRLIPNPNYFRIHDSGDFYSLEYLEAWFSVVKHMKDIQFWAPTRIWSNPEAMEWINSVSIPKNLALRPSGIFFDAPEPVVPGMSAGTSSNLIHFKEEASGRYKVSISNTGPNAWACPAFLPTVLGGGAYPKTEEKLEAGKRRYKKAKSGMVKKNPAYIYPQNFPLVASDIDVRELPKGYVFYDAMYNVDKKGFILDSHGRPQKASRANISKAKKAGINYKIVKTQAYEVAGNCALAVDMDGKEECRVCWGKSGGEKSNKAFKLPVVYAKH